MSEARIQNGAGVCQPVARQGIALIVVLGMLALMVLMGVTFSIYMRTERMAAGNFRNDVQARQLLHVALNRAMEGIDSAVTTNVYPPWDCLASDEAGSTNISGATNSPVMDWIPTAAMGMTLNPQPRWITNGVGAGKAEGRVGYLVVNCSGLLDANYAGGATVRRAGTNVAELQVGSLPETPVVADLVTARNVPFRTHQELFNYGFGVGCFGQRPCHFATFSFYPTNSSLIDIGGSVSNLLADRAKIEGAFRDCLAASPESTAGFDVNVAAGILFTNLIDYVDDNSIPGDLGGTVTPNPLGPSVEPVWMINEVAMTNSIKFQYDGSNWVMVAGSVSGYCELWFPFKVAIRTGYRSIFKAQFTSSSGPQYLPASFSSTRYLNGGNEFLVHTFSNNVPGIGSSFATLPLTVDLHATVNPVVEKSVGAVVVDVVTNLDLDLSAEVTTVGTNAYVGGWKCMECIDPRLNYDTNVWVAGLGSEGNTNARTRRSLGLPGAGVAISGWQERDGDTSMFVGNRRMEGAGELGYLFFGQAWETIRLYHHGRPERGLAHPVLDRFYVFNKDVINREKGLVNVNTRDTNVLAAVFLGLPLDYPHGLATVTLDLPWAQDMAHVVVSNTSVAAITNLSVLGDHNWALEYPAGSDMDKESFLRNSIGLLGYRQNLFTIVLYAQTTKTVLGMTDKSVVSEVRAIAEVWRDPLPVSGPHAYFVRTFKILNN